MLKHFIIFIILSPVASLAQSSINDKRVDSFLKQQFEFLDNQIDSIYTSEKEYQVALEEQPKVIDYFERLTGIKAEIFHGYVYAKILQRKTIDSWKEWTKENRKLLTWDILRSSVNRVDRDIFN